MKQLLTVLLVFCTSISFVLGQKWPPTLEEVLKDPMGQAQGRGVQYRDGLPELFIDSVYWEGRYLQDGGISSISYDRYRYNTDNRVIQHDFKSTNYPDFLGNWRRTTYEFDASGNEISSLRVWDNDGIITLNSKSTSTYNSSNKIVEKISYSWVGSWRPSSKNNYEYPNSLTSIRTEQSMEDELWVDRARNTKVLNNEGFLTLNTDEVWDLDLEVWQKVSEMTQEYDANGNLILFQFLSGNPLEFNTKVEYHYDAQGRNDVFTNYNWDTNLNDWKKAYLTNQIFNAEDQIIEKLFYLMDSSGTQPLIYSRFLFAYGEGIFSMRIKEALHHIWDDSSQVFLDKSRSMIDLIELPNDKIWMKNQYQEKSPSGTPEWLTQTYSEYFYHTNPEVSSPEPQTLKPCQAPNPYPTGYKVACNGLQENGSYLLYVYDTQGKVAYARHFKGGDGWSIHQNLPVGAYIAAIVRNGERISTQRLVIGQ